MLASVCDIFFHYYLRCRKVEPFSTSNEKRNKYGGCGTVVAMLVRYVSIFGNVFLSRPWWYSQAMHTQFVAIWKLYS